ncbi:cell separation during budding [Blastocladiella emersonii ATCC 22665]|nr:cell separation during budding [Blastocladiella emersonii ATCC 22665]
MSSTTLTFSADQHAALRKAWATATVADLLKAHWKAGTKAVVTVKSSMPVEEAFDILVQNNINAAPVYDADADAYIGMVSMLDVVEYVMTLVRANKAVWQELDAELPSPTHVQAQEPDRSGLAIAEIVQRIRQVRPIPVSYISDLAKRDPFMALPRSATLEHAMDIFSKGIHRIVITEADDKANVLVGILTQSDIVRFLSEREKEAPFNDVLKMRLNDLKLSTPKEIVLVKAFQPVVDALQAMHTSRVSSVAVVDATERLLGNISASDVKHIMRHLRYGILFETCSQFIGGVKTRQMLDNAGKDTVPVIEIAKDATLSRALRLIVVTKVHRLWCVEQDSRLPSFQAPVAVVSLTDILRVLL